MTTDATAPRLVPDPAKVEALLHRLAGDLGAALASAGAVIGHRLGLYRALADGGPQTPRELAERTGIEERYAREWLCGQAARGYVTYDPKAETFALTPEQAACLAGEESPMSIGGAFVAPEQWRHALAARPEQEVTGMAEIQIKSFDSPDEVRPFEGNGKADVLDIGGRTVGRTILEPGWRWSENVKPIAGTDSCQVSHLGYCLSGRMKVIMDDGSESEIAPGNVAAIPPGHDAEVVGDEQCVFLDFGEFGEFAKRH